MTKGIQIFRGFTDEQWNGLRKKLDDGDESAWSCAIEVFERRIRERFFACIEALIVADPELDVVVSPGSAPDCSTLPNAGERRVVVPGFAILALCCLLVETLQRFWEKPPKKAAVTGRCTFPDGRCIKIATTDQFRDFLQRPAFRGEFDKEEIAKSFIKGVRNEIFHEAETRKWVIKRDSPRGRVLSPESKLKDKRYTLNRTEFYQAIKTEFDDYLRQLRDPNNSSLRLRFVKKMIDIVNEC